MFLGPEGGGNLPLALAFASYILCENPGSDDRCGHCPACKQLDQLSHPDLHFSFPFVKSDKVKTTEGLQRSFAAEVVRRPYLTLPDWEATLEGTKKTIITAEEANHMVKSLSLKAFSKGHKVMVIWQAEKLHNAAANKLLKTLEEPTDRTLIILVCSRVEELLPTIRSRVQLVTCEPLSEGDIARALVEREGMEWNEAEDYAARADGSYQAALLLREQAEVNQAYLALFTGWMRHTYKRNFAEVFKLGDAFSKLGKDGQQHFLEYALDFIHLCIMREFADKGHAGFDPQAAAFAEKFAPYITGGNMHHLHDVLSGGHYLVERNANANLLFAHMSTEFMRYFAQRKAAKTE